MYITFNNVTIHNFLSYGHAELDLKNKHYCLVSGINNDPKDNAASNGAGKSTWSSAICWALTGETIQGLTSNVKNINVDEDICYVLLDFEIDGNKYLIKRVKNPKSDLKIELNGKDISGKGIRESEAILKERIPDLTSQLLASIIILGQGLPYKFTGNTPSGRKEVLEQLSKSDFMIKDLKERITNRVEVLNKEMRQVEDKILIATSQKEMLKNQLAQQEIALKDLQLPKNFDSELSALHSVIDKTKQELLALNETKSKCAVKLQDIQLEITGIQSQQNLELNPEIEKFNLYKDAYNKEKIKQKSEILSLNSKIKEMDSISDICPTCGQKIAGIVKPDTSKLKDEVKAKELAINQLDKNYTQVEAEYSTLYSNIQNKYKLKLSNLQDNYTAVRQQISNFEFTISQEITKSTEFEISYNKILVEKETYTENLKKMNNVLADTKTRLKKLEEEILYNNSEKQSISDHAAIVTQMNTLIKRDFRGYLLSNVISYINLRAKEYCQDIFKTQDLEFKLAGNNIEISYGNKSFENLSGGEQQRVDLILQFAIRDMMKQYLGFSSNILILDEIFDQLDIAGCNNVLNLISNRLDDVESIFIISHRAGELEIPYDCELLVTKNEKGVSSTRWQ